VLRYEPFLKELMEIQTRVHTPEAAADGGAGGDSYSLSDGEADAASFSGDSSGDEDLPEFGGEP